MKVLVTGARGQLGSDLVPILKDVYQVFGFSRAEMDVTNMTQVVTTIHQLNPDVVIHTAAYTQVDQAESDKDRAFLVNAFGTRNVAAAAQQIGAKIIYISTDYVFDGEQTTPYTEFDQPNPRSVYGKSKLAGEELVKSLSDKYFIVRTSWVCGKHGHNFMKTMLKLAQTQEELRVVNDQIGSPTFTRDLAHFLKKLMVTDYYGTYHATNTGICSWYDFAKAIFEEYNVPIKLTAIQTKDFPRPAPRPAFSALDHMSIRLHQFADFRHWKEALQDYKNS